MFKQNDPWASPTGRKPGVTPLFTPRQWQAIADRLAMSPRELQIVELFTWEATDGAIAAALGVSQHTVRTHVERLHQKLGVSTRCGVMVQAFRAFLENGASPPSDGRD